MIPMWAVFFLVSILFYSIGFAFMIATISLNYLTAFNAGALGGGFVVVATFFLSIALRLASANESADKHKAGS